MVHRACVSPRVNTADPWTRGSTPTLQLIGRMSSNPRPSGRTPFRIASRVAVSSTSLKIARTFLARSF